MDAVQIIIKQRLGIHVGEEKYYLLASKLQKLMAAAGLGSVGAAISFLKEDTAESSRLLARCFTTNHTFFFREASHFQVLAELASHAKKHPLLLWCAAASTGEEAYSMAISLLQAGVRDFRIMASDINIENLKVCRRGIYHADRFKFMPPDLRLQYFRKLNHESGQNYWQVSDSLKEKVVLRRLNLLDRFRFQADFSFIFCRNVMIYFDKTTQRQVLKNLTANLLPGGYLFVGHSEPIMVASPRLVQAGVSVYRKTAG